MSLAYYTMDDLRLGRGGFLQKGWTIRQRPELGEALAHYRGMPITKRKVLGLTDGFHVLELVKNVPLFPDDNPAGIAFLIKNQAFSGESCIAAFHQISVIIVGQFFFANG